jgi:hypothetical protein
VEQSLRVGHDRLHLDDQEAAGPLMQGEHIDRASFAPDREGNFDQSVPPEIGQSLHERFDGRCVVLVQQAVQMLAAVPDPDVDVCPERGCGADERSDRHAVELPAIDGGDEGSRQTSLPCHIRLPATQADPERSELAAEPKGIHARILTGSALRPIN